jgi:hypothetical protein
MYYSSFNNTSTMPFLIETLKFMLLLIIYKYQDILNLSFLLNGKNFQ